MLLPARDSAEQTSPSHSMHTMLSPAQQYTADGSPRNLAKYNYMTMFRRLHQSGRQWSFDKMFVITEVFA